MFRCFANRHTIHLSLQHHGPSGSPLVVAGRVRHELRVVQRARGVGGGEPDPGAQQQTLGARPPRLLLVPGPRQHAVQAVQRQAPAPVQDEELRPHGVSVQIM